MTEQEYDEALLDEIKKRILANTEEMKRCPDDPRDLAFSGVQIRHLRSWLCSLASLKHLEFWFVTN